MRKPPDQAPEVQASAPLGELKLGNIVGFGILHLIAMLAMLPWLFSWTGVILLIAGFYLYGVLGINIGFHRLLAHRGFKCPLWFERILVVLGTASLQFSPVLWVAVHRRHHHFSDEERDPHSPLKGFYWAHFGWLLARRHKDMKPAILCDRYAKDLLRDPLCAMLERRNNWIRLNLALWAGYFLSGFAVALATDAGIAAAAQFGASLLVWGCALRTVMVWHLTWAVNSISHIWGYRNYDTPDDSRNNLFIGIFAAGEGWHNNHHADPTSARHGHRWWELDLSWLTIRLLMLLGLATDVAMPSPSLKTLAKS